MARSRRHSGEIKTFAEVLDQAITHRGAKLETIQRRLAERGFSVSTASLSYWRTGRSVPARRESLRAIPHLEQVLGLRTGDLTSRLPTGPNRSRTAPLAKIPKDIEHVVLACLADLGLDVDQELVETSVQVTVDVDADGSIRAYTFRTVVRAARDGARRLPMIISESDRTGAPDLVTGPGAHIGAVVHRHEDGVYAAEVVLDRPLVKDALAVLEHGERFGPGVFTDPFMIYCPVRRLAEVVLWVRFHPDRLPTSVIAFHEGRDGEVALQADLTGTTAQLALLQWGPGEMGLRWRW